MSEVNPYDLHQITFNDQLIYARPIEWNSGVVDQKTMLTPFNEQFRATKLTLTCPDCGTCVTLDIYNSIETNYYCDCVGLRQADKKGQITDDPFRNPIEAITDLNILYPSKTIEPVVATAKGKKKKSACKKSSNIETASKIKASEEDEILDLANRPFDDSDLLE